MDWISDKLYYCSHCNDHLLIAVFNLATKQHMILLRDFNVSEFYGSDIVVDPTTRLYTVII